MRIYHVSFSYIKCFITGFAVAADEFWKFTFFSKAWLLLSIIPAL